MILVYFRWPQPVDSATNRTVPICPQSRVSVLFCSLSSPALDRSAPNRGSPGGGGESPQASSIYIYIYIRRPLAGVSDVGSDSVDSVDSCYAIPAPPVPLYQPTFGPRWSTVDPRWFEVLPSGRPQSRPGAPETLPRRSRDALCSLRRSSDVIFMPSGPILE